MTIADLLGRLALLLVAQPEDATAAALLVVAAALVVVVVAVATDAPVLAARAAATAGRFERVRVLLRASDPAAAGHRRARAPGRSAQVADR